MAYYQSRIQEIIDAKNYHDSLGYFKIKKMNNTLLTHLEIIVFSELDELIETYAKNADEKKSEHEKIKMILRKICEECGV